MALQAGAVPDMDTLSEAVQHFVNRYPVDSRAYEFLVTSPPQVLAHVLREFRPSREGETDYSGLVTSYVKRVRSGYMGGDLSSPGHPRPQLPIWRPPSAAPPPAPAPEVGQVLTAAVGILQNALQADVGGLLLTNLVGTLVKQLLPQQPRPCRPEPLPAPAPASPPRPQLPIWRPPHQPQHSQPLQPLVLANGPAPAPAVSAASLLSALLNGDAHSELAHSAAVGILRQELTEALQTFLQKYPVDEKAYNLLAGADPSVQAKVVLEFKPAREGDADYSALLTSFTRKCAEQLGIQLPLPLAAPSAAQAAPVHAWLPPEGAPKELTTALVTPGLEAFLARYPVDDRAWDFFASSPVEVQAKVLRDFRPMREGEPSYSGLLTSYVKKCRLESGFADEGGPYPPGGGLLEPRQQIALSPAELQEVEEQVSAFLERYPCDARAADFLLSAPPEVKQQVLREFRPKMEGEADYSAPVTAYVRRCRNAQLAAEGHGGFRIPPARTPPAGGWGPPKRPRFL